LTGTLESKVTLCRNQALWYLNGLGRRVKTGSRHCINFAYWQ
jgi:hypothetical protein